MGYLTIHAAARLAGTSRTTMDRALRSGKISYTTTEKGVRLVDPAEVARAFPDTAGTPQRDERRDAEVRPVDMVVVQMQARIADLERTIADLRAERDRLLSIVEQREQRQLPAPRSGWWRSWRRPL